MSRIVKSAPVGPDAVVIDPRAMRPASPDRRGSRQGAVEHDPAEVEKMLVAARAQARELLDRAQAEADGLIAAAQQQLAEARALVEAAEADAETIRAVAHDEAHRAGLEAGRQEGLAQGHAEGRAEAEAQVAAATAEQLSRLRDLAGAAAYDRTEMVRQSEAALVELTLAIAGRVVRQELATDPTIVLRTIRQALDQIAAAEPVRVRVNPDDYTALAAHWPDIEQFAAGGKPCQVLPDAQVTPGGCIVEAGVGRVNASIEAQFAELRAALIPEVEPSVEDEVVPANP